MSVLADRCFARIPVVFLKSEKKGVGKMVIGIQAVVWLLLLVLLLGLEAVTLGLTTIWFAGGALTGFILSLIGVDLLWQLIMFCIVSVLLLIFTRPVAVKWLNKDRVKTNAESLIGEAAVVVEQIDNLTGSGQVQVRGQFWTARNEEVEGNGVIEIGKTVKIQKISGVKLIVKEEKL